VTNEQWETIEASVTGERGELALNRPDKLNPLSIGTMREIIEAVRFLDRHPALKVVVVRGRGRAFSSGADVSAFGSGGLASRGGAPPIGGERSAREDADTGHRLTEALERMDAVTVAAVQGHCVGGGVVLAAACDLRIAADDARFLIPEVELGIPLAWGGIPRLVREIGPALTKELVMTCRPFDANEAKAAGFVNAVVPLEGLDAAVEDLVATLVAKPKLALLATKRHTNAVTESMVNTWRSWSDADGLLAGLRDQEGRESAQRYLERVRSKRH
jgi:enoyl-CoA hydratase/carnithine racemase